MRNILVVAAHPDDETLGAGGAMARHVAEGDRVSVLILGTGIASRKEKGANIGAEVKRLREDSVRALSKLGVKDVKFCDFPDNSFDSVPLLDVIREVSKAVEEKKAQIVYTHHWGDLNIDHRRTFKAVVTACRPVEGGTVRKIACFEVLSSTEWNVQNAKTAFLPNMFVDISKTLGRKIEALKEYRSELGRFPHPRSPEAVEALARVRGCAAGLSAAEAFEIVRESA